MPAIDPIPILFVTANPDGPEPLATDVEARRIDEALWNSLNRERFVVHKLPAARIGDLAVYLRRHRPRILHIALHATAEGLLFNDPEDWREQALAGEELAAIVAAYQAEATEKLRLVVLAGCGTENAARLLSAQVECAIGTTDDISDGAVLRFSPAFYAALGDGRSIGNAFAGAHAELRGHGRQSDADLLRLIPQPGIDPNSLRLDTPTRRPLSDAHREYLRRWFGQPWATVNLADISQRQERVSLLDVYVPLPVDFKLDIEVKDHQIVDWWVHRDNPETRRGGLQPPNLPDEDASDSHEIEPAKARIWPDLGVGEAELKGIVSGFQSAIEADKESWTYRWDRVHTMALEAEQAASLRDRFVLLGEPGGGKSSFLRHLTLCLAGELRRQDADPTVPDNASLKVLPDWSLGALTPIYIELRALVAGHFSPLPDDEKQEPPLPGIRTFWAYVREELLDSGWDDFGKELQRFVTGGQALLLLDGLDEIPQASDKRRRRQMKAFIAALTHTYPQLRVIVSSRPYAYYRDDWSPEGFGRATLAHLDWQRLQELAQALFAAVDLNRNGDEAEAFLQAIQNDSHIEPGLHRNPLFFTLLAALWLNPDAPRQLPITRAALYRQATDLLLGRWTRSRLSEPSVIQQMGIAPEHLRPVLENLACTVTEQSRPGQDTTLIRVGLLAEIFHRARLRVVNLDVSDYLSRHSGILVEQADGEFAFIHRSFQEHLAACELTCRHPGERTPPVPPERHFPAGLLQRVLERPDLWQNVAGLAADELLAQGRRDELIRLLVEMARPYYREKAKPETAFLALSIAQRLRLLADRLDEFDLRNLLRQVALDALTNVALFEPEQRLIAGQLLGSRPGLDSRPGVGIVETQNFASLPDIDWVKIPEIDAEGRREFIYQEDERRTEPDFWMARFPITYAQFQCFIDAADGWSNPEWWEGLSVPDEQKAKPDDQYFPYWNHPRESISWFQAIAFCRWLTAQAQAHPEILPAEMRHSLACRITLPTEWQWEKSAWSYDGRRYPWGGDEYRIGYANIDERTNDTGPHYLQTTNAVGMYPQGASPYGIADMSGNVWEWCLNEYEDPEKIEESGSAIRVLRGGGWLSLHDFAAAVSRYGYFPDGRDGGFGFRVVLCRSVPVPHL